MKSCLPTVRGPLASGERSCAPLNPFLSLAPGYQVCFDFVSHSAIEEYSLLGILPSHVYVTRVGDFMSGLPCLSVITTSTLPTAARVCCLFWCFLGSEFGQLAPIQLCIRSGAVLPLVSTLVPGFLSFPPRLSKDTARDGVSSANQSCLLFFINPKS